MYINPFWAGVLTTVFVELATLFIASIVIIWRENDD